MLPVLPDPDWNHTDRTYYPDECAHELFGRGVASKSDSIAAICETEQLTYGELDRRSNQLARYLRECGVAPDVLVGICVERSFDMMVGVLGILKAGGAYVPLDPALPRERLSYLIDDAHVGWLLTQNALVSRLPLSDAKLILLDKQRNVIDEHSPATVDAGGSSDNLAYVIYTSGSTGQPKGVCLPHRSLVNLLHWQLEQSKVGQGQRTLQFTSLSFDVSFQEIFSTLCSGGTLVLITEALRRDPVALLTFLRQQKIARLFLPFVALQQLAAAAEGRALPTELREVITAGEQLRITPQIASFFARMPTCTLFNHYGPSESHVVTSYTLSGPPDKWNALPPIGKPISNARIYILDSEMNPVPVGAVGELYIGGVGLARGYHSRPELTAERFVQSPLGPGARLYKTGDFCRYLPDGNIQYVGRMDDQVKIRGYRVELGEIESVLATHPSIRQCVVIAREDGGEKRLVAYVVAGANQQPSGRRLRDFLKAQVPDYMVPAVFVLLNRLPISPNGKIDRRALPAPTRDNALIEGELIPPRDDLERKLVAIWESTLNLSPIGISDNIFDLGVDSLLAAELFAKIEKTLGKQLPPAPLFQAPTVESLASLLRQHNSQKWSSLVTIQPHGTKTPLFCVHGGAGTVLLFNSLARHLAPERPVYGLQARGLYGRERPHTSVKDMAAHYIREMRTVQPRGPYLIGGWCFGGIVAFEIAQQLQFIGEKVDLLVMFNAASRPEEYAADVDPAPTDHARKPAKAYHSRWHQFAALPAREKFSYFAGGVRRKLRRGQYGLSRYARGVSRRTLCRLYIALRLPLPDDIRNYYFLYMNTIAERRYKPKPYVGDMLIFRDQGPYRDPSLGWADVVTGRIESHEVSVSTTHHRALMQEPAVGAVAEKLQEFLTRRAITATPVVLQQPVKELVGSGQTIESNVVQ